MKTLLKLLVVLLAITPVSAAPVLPPLNTLLSDLLPNIQVKRVNDFIYVGFTFAGQGWCYSNSISKIPTQFTNLSTIIAAMGVMTPEEQLACAGGTPPPPVPSTVAWVVAPDPTTTYFLPGAQMRFVAGLPIHFIPVGTACEGLKIARIDGIREWRYSTDLTGYRGLVQCVLK